MTKHKKAEPPPPSIVAPNSKHLIAALAGGVIVFLWSLFSMMVLPWYQNNMNQFTDEMQVANVIRDNTTMSGVYILPNTFNYNEATPTQQVADGVALLERGPFMFCSIMKNGVGPMSAWPFVIGFFIDFAGALIVTWMLLLTTNLTYGRMVGFVSFFALSIGILCQLPMWNWWGFPFIYAVINIIDLVIAWTLGGYAIAYFLKKK